MQPMIRNCGRNSNQMSRWRLKWMELSKWKMMPTIICAHATPGGKGRETGKPLTKRVRREASVGRAERTLEIRNTRASSSSSNKQAKHAGTHSWGLSSS